MDVQFDLTAEGQLQFFQEPGASGDDVNNTFSGWHKTFNLCRLGHLYVRCN